MLFTSIIILVNPLRSKKPDNFNVFSLAKAIDMIVNCVILHTNEITYFLILTQIKI